MIEFGLFVIGKYCVVVSFIGNLVSLMSYFICWLGYKEDLFKKFLLLVVLCNLYVGNV